jgi:hypothetical protein
VKPRRLERPSGTNSCAGRKGSRGCEGVLEVGDLSPAPAACRQALPGASGPPRSRSAARRWGALGTRILGPECRCFRYLCVPVVTRDSGQGSCQGRYPQESAKIAMPTRIPQTVMKTSRRRATRSSFHPRNQGSSYIRAAGRVSSLARRDTDSAWRDTRTSPTALNSTTPAPTTTPSNHIARFSIGKRQS